MYKISCGECDFSYIGQTGEENWVTVSLNIKFLSVGVPIRQQWGCTQLRQGMKCSWTVPRYPELIARKSPPHPRGHSHKRSDPVLNRDRCSNPLPGVLHPSPSARAFVGCLQVAPAAAHVTDQKTRYWRNGNNRRRPPAFKCPPTAPDRCRGARLA